MSNELIMGARTNESAPPVAQFDLSRFSPENRRRLSSPGLRTFMAIADIWGLTEDERRAALGSPSRSTYYRWRRRAREDKKFTLTVDTLTRISAVIGIHQALKVLFLNVKDAKEWLTSPHDAPEFDGNPPLGLATGGTLDGLLRLRRFLEGARGGLYMSPNAIDKDFEPYSDEEIVIQ